jgi:UDP-GlcNAc3NAcA epimerase
VYGDTNSTLAGALAAAKLHIPVIHVEAGLRSFNKSMPEEINRICTDHVSTFLFSPTEAGITNLQKEGFRYDASRPVSADNPLVKNVGDVMYDNSLFFAELAERESAVLEKLDIKGRPFALCTIHRDFNTDRPERLQFIFEGLNRVAETGMTIVLPIHPRTRKHLAELKSAPHNGIRITDPVSFFDMIMLEMHSSLIITDSGGVQKEAYFFKKPCIVLRPETEWVEILETGNGALADADPEAIYSEFVRFNGRTQAHYPELYGTGRAAERILEEVLQHLGRSN